MNREEAGMAIDAALDGLAESLESGMSANLLAYLDTMAKFHRYSFSNQMLIWKGFITQAAMFRIRSRKQRQKQWLTSFAGPSAWSARPERKTTFNLGAEIRDCSRPAWRRFGRWHPRSWMPWPWNLNPPWRSPIRFRILWEREYEIQWRESMDRRSRTPVSDDLRQEIRESGLAQAEIARHAGVPQGAISKFLAKKYGLTLVNVDKLALFFRLQLKK